MTTSLSTRSTHRYFAARMPTFRAVQAPTFSTIRRISTSRKWVFSRLRLPSVLAFSTTMSSATGNDCAWIERMQASRYGSPWKFTTTAEIGPSGGAAPSELWLDSAMV